MSDNNIGPELAAALAAFQAEMPKVHKGKTAKVPTKAGGSYSYTYADLADVTAAAAPVLARHGLSFSAVPRAVERGYELVGILLHCSGQYLTGALPINGGSEQAMGSSLTYGRRYLLGCLTGIVTDDDEDGALSTQSPRQAARPTPPPADPVIEAKHAVAAAWRQTHGGDLDPAAAANDYEQRYALPFADAGVDELRRYANDLTRGPQA